MDRLGKGISPFWFWNGDMQITEIERQVDEMAEKGLTGFLIHPRQGMTVPYMSEEYFRRIRAAVDRAALHGMQVWLYDEYPYPSGVAAGKVMEDHPEFRCRSLEKFSRIVFGPETVVYPIDFGRVISARAYPVRGGETDFSTYIDLTDKIGIGYSEEIFQQSGLTAYSRKRFFTGKPNQTLMWEAPAGEYRIYVYIEKVMEDFKYFRYFVDTLNPDAIRYFIECTHEQYKRVLGDAFGTTIRGIFSDEITAFPPQQPWSPLLPGLFEEKCGYSLIDVLPALTEDFGEKTSKIRYDYWNTVTDAFIDAYDKPVYQWCEDNHLMYIGEKPILRSRELAYVHVPGIDAGHAKVGGAIEPFPGNNRANPKFAASAAHFYQKPAALCEAFHSIGWGMTLQDMKWIFDWLALGGVDWFVPHAYYYTTDNLRKHDAPPSAFFQMPWWPEQKKLSEYALGLGRFLSEGRHVKTLYVDPVTSLWVLDEKEKAAVRQKLGVIMDSLMQYGQDFYVIDPDLLAQARVIVRNHQAYLSVNGELFDSIVLPMLNNLDDGAFRVFRKFVESNGTAVAAGCLPDRNLQEEKAAQWFIDTFLVSVGQHYVLCRPEETGRVMKTLRQDDLWEIDVLPKGVYFASSRTDSGERLLLINTTAKRIDLDLPAAVIGEAHEIDLIDGHSLRHFPMNGLLSVSLEPWASAAFEITGVFPELLPEKAVSCRETISLPLSASDWSMKLNRKNALYLGEWELNLPDGQGGRVGCAPILDQMEELGLKARVETLPMFGCPKELLFVPQQVTYSAEFVIESLTPVQLVMEPDSLLGQWTIEINDYLYTSASFHTEEVYVPTNRVCDVTEALHTGINQVTVQVYCEQTFDGLRNPLYLFGDFGVAMRNGINRILPLAAQGTPGKTVENGLPYYAGSVRFEKEIFLDSVPEDGVCFDLHLPGCQDACHVYVNGQDLGAVLWNPRQLAVPAACLKAGGNHVCLEIATTLIGLFEGQFFDEHEGRYVLLSDRGNRSIQTGRTYMSRG